MSSCRIEHPLLKAPVLGVLNTAQSPRQYHRGLRATRSDVLRLHAEAAGAYADHPVLLRVRELETLARLATNAEARLYIGFDKHAELQHAD